MKRFVVVFCVIMVVSHFRTTVYACKCVNTSEADVYCSSDFVIHAQLSDVSHVNETLKKMTILLTKYKVKSSKIYKKTVKYVDDGFLYSAPTSCGVRLEVSKNGANDYLFAGYVAQNKSFLHGCSWAKNWATEAGNGLKTSLEKAQFDQNCPDRQIQRENEHLRNLRRQIRLNQSLATTTTNNHNVTSGKKTPKFLIF